jgi:hypothetical protein
MQRIKSSREYAAIAREYGERRARRSRVPLIQHIDDGLTILDAIGASDAAQRAFCLHPLLQDDAANAANIGRTSELTDDAHVLALTLEYRRVANAALSSRELARGGDIELSPMAEVNDMLVADKVQNRRDFLRHHLGSHPRSAILDRYFELWLERLGVSAARYAELAAKLGIDADAQ